MFKEGLKTLKLAKGIKDFKSSTDLESKKAAAQFINEILDSEKVSFLKLVSTWVLKQTLLMTLKPSLNLEKKPFLLLNLYPTSIKT